MEKPFEATDLQVQNAQLCQRNAELEATVTTLTATVSGLTATVQELSAMVAHFKELFTLAQRYGASSEKHTPGLEQINLFSESALPGAQGQPNEVTTTDASIDAQATETISYTRRKTAGKRKDDLSKLPLEVVEHELPESQRVCPDCGEPLKETGVETRDELKIIPPQVIRVAHRRHVYKCAGCGRHTEKTPIIKAQTPAPVIKGSVASPSLAAYIMTQKYLMHLPLYRLEQDFKRQGAPINRQNMANWAIQVSEDWLTPIYDRLYKKLRAHTVLHSGGTSTQVLREPGKRPQSKSTMWMYRTGGDSSTPVILYEYQPDREGKHPKTFLSDWKGYCHADGYSGIHNIPDVIIVGCWAHVRRKFNDAYQLTKTPDSLAAIGLAYCDQLFALEKRFANLSAEDRYGQRMDHSKPVAGAFFQWAKSAITPPGLAITRAITYLLNQREWLMNVYLDGRLELSNNRGERSVKPFVMGRKNWLFSNSVSGAKASAVAFSIIETAKENGLKPFEYLTYLFQMLPNATTDQLNDLLPWSRMLPAACRVSP